MLVVAVFFVEVEMVAGEATVELEWKASAQLFVELAQLGECLGHLAARLVRPLNLSPFSKH